MSSSIRATTVSGRPQKLRGGVSVAAGATAGVLLAVLGFRAMWPGPPPRAETRVRPIPMVGGPEVAEAEISGMAWFDRESLVLLPQNAAEAAEPMLYVLPRVELSAFVGGVRSDPVRARGIPLDLDPGIADHPGFDGFEAVAFRGREVFLAVELRDGDDGDAGLLLRGEVIGELERVVIDLEAAEVLPAQSMLDNMGYESLVVHEDHVYALYEVNAEPNQEPRAFALEPGLTASRDLSFPPLEYRVTDATAVDDRGRFWVANYHWPGADWEPGACALTETFGVGSSHMRCDTVERLVELQIVDGAVRLSGRAPLLFELVNDDRARNWEGVVRFEDGFLVVTDTYPEPMLGFVKPQDPGDLPNSALFP